SDVSDNFVSDSWSRPGISDAGRSAWALGAGARSVMNIQGIGFDLGETLIFYRDTPLSWASRYRDALGHVAEHCSIAPTPAQFAAAEQILPRYNTRIVPRTREVSAKEILSLVLRSWNLDGTADLEAATEAFFSFFQQRVCAHPEAGPMLSGLRKRGI